MVIHRLTHLLLAAALITGATAAYAPAAFAQSQSINGTIRGRVSDPSGASVAGATVTVSNPALGFSRTATTSSDGYYTLINLPLGTYKVNITAPGFAALNVQNVTLNAGTEAQINGALTIGGTSTEVTVEASASGIDPTNLNVQRTLTPREIENVPLTSRNPYNFIIFQPGMSGHPNQELGIPRTLNTNGLMDRINYQMDGMVNTEADRIGLRLFPIGNIFVKEVQTVSNSFAPEYGWTTGDVYNVISNSGTNQFHGMYQFIKRWVDATAYPLLQNKSTSPAKPNLVLEDHSFNLGGPVFKDRLFFFGSYEHVLRGSPSSVTITPANAAAIGLSTSELAPAPGTLHGTFMDARLDFTLNNKNQIFARYNYFKNSFPFNTQVGGLNARSAGVDFSDRAHVFGVQWISTITDHLLNEFRFSSPFRANAHFAGPETGPGPAIVISSVANFGGTYSAGDQYNDRQPSGSDNISYIHGAHTFKAGIIIDQLENKQRAVSFNRYTFASIQDYLDAKSGARPKSYTLFESQTDTTGVNYASLFLGAYAQDTWQLSPRLVAVYGVRWDRFIPPMANPNAPWADSQKFNSPATNFGPRLGFSYRTNTGTVLKASAGLFYQQTPTNLWFNALNKDGSNRTSAYSYSPTQPNAPSFPGVPSGAGSAAVQSVTTVNPNIKNEYTWNINAQIEQQLSPRDTLRIGYIMANGRNLPYMHNINYINPIGTLADGRPVFSTANCPTSSTPAPGCPSDGRATRLNNNFNAIDRVESGANSSFNALFFNYTMALRRGLQINANYTWSHAITDAPEVNTFEQNLGISNTLDRKFDRGNASVNRPSAFNLTAVLEPEFHFDNKFGNELANHNMLAILANASSGDQGNLTAATSNLNGDPSTSGVGRPAFVGRNSLRSPKIGQVDARYTRTFPKIKDRIAASFLLEANNVFNTNNLTQISGTQVTSSNGVPTAAPKINLTTVLEARIVQWGLKVEF